jgi:hypothetical protein
MRVRLNALKNETKAKELEHKSTIKKQRNELPQKLFS